MKKSVWQEKYQIIAVELKALRERKGLTQVELAEKLGKPQSFVSKYENGERYLDFIEVLSVYQACSASLSELVEKLGYDFDPES